MNMNFYIPTRLFTGKDCIKLNASALTSLGSSCLIVTGAHAAKACGALDDVTAVLDAAGVAWEVFNGIGQNPKLADCLKAAEQAMACKAEFVIGIGGGSPMDAAKCIAALTANPGISVKDLYALNWKNPPLKVAAIGTTSGTGSEVTKVAVITNLEGYKKSIKADTLYPAVSFGDPTYTMTLSDHFTRSTAVDALAHSMESYFTNISNEVSSNWAVRSIRILMEEFKAILEKGTENLTFEDREALYNASIYGGMAIAVTGTCMPHAMGYLLTEEFGIPHGIASAVYLPELYFHNKKTAPELAARFLSDIGCTEEEFLSTLEAVLPKCDVTLTEEQIQKEHFRWVGNVGMEKTWTIYTPEMADEVLRRMFVR